MPVFTAIAAGVTALATAVGFGAAAAATIGAVGAFAARTLLTVGITKLIANRAGTNAAGAQDAGARVQLPPSTNNVLPIIYGSAFVAPTIVDAKISSDQKTMWYVCALSEVADGGSFTFGDIYYNGSLVTFDTTDPAKIVKLTNNANPPQEDTKIAGSVYMYLYTNGSSSGVNTGGQTAIQIMSDSGIPATERWDSTLYTQGGTASASMTKTAFVIVKINYNRDSGFTSIGQINAQLISSLTRPGDVLLDYMTNSRYGCALPLDQIDVSSLASLNTYSDELITYTPVTGGTASQARYRINGPINTGQSCLNNLQIIADSCDSWLQYSEMTGKWKIVINQSYTDYTTIENLYHVDSYNLIGGIDINPIDLNSTYNSLEVQYPDQNIKDQTNYKTINLIDFVPEVMSPNEPANKLIIQFPIVNNYIQATYLGERRMLQSREDLVISFALDYSGIQIEAGDVIRVTLNEYGWNSPTFPGGKLFRVTQVQETKDDSGFLGARVTASEYNDTIYANNPIQNFVPEGNTGLSNPNIHSQVLAPTIITSPNTDGTVKSFTVTGIVPTTGTVLNMDFNYGTNSDIATYKLYKTVSPGDGKPYTAGASVSISVTDLTPATYFWSVTARNTIAGRSSPPSTSYSWAGPNVTTYDPVTNTGGISGSNIQYNAITINNMGEGAAGFYQRTRYDPRLIEIAGVVTIPNVTTTSTRNIPLQYSGNTYSSSELNTWESGTWPYASTSPSGLGYYVPAVAQSVVITEGEQGWYKVIFNDLSGDYLTPNEWAVLTGYMNFSSDTANTVIQLVRYSIFDNNVITLQLRTLQTINISNSLPYTTMVTLSDGFTGLSTAGGILEIGYLVRNVTSGTTITAISGSLTTKQNK